MKINNGIITFTHISLTSFLHSNNNAISWYRCNYRNKGVSNSLLSARVIHKITSQQRAAACSFVCMKRAIYYLFSTTYSNLNGFSAILNTLCTANDLENWTTFTGIQKILLSIQKMRAWINLVHRRIDLPFLASYFVV